MHYNYKCDKSFYNKNTNVHKIIQTLKQNHPRTHKHTYKHTHTHTHARTCIRRHNYTPAQERVHTQYNLNDK